MSHSEDRKKERFWTNLLTLLERGDAVPVVGEEMLCLPPDCGGATLYSALANQYAAENEISLEEPLKGNLSATVRRHPDFFTKPLGICQEIADQCADWKGPIPESLRALARIWHFNLFVSTTFDDLLERALNEERFGGEKLTQVIAYAPNNIPSDQVIADALARLKERPLIFNLFGSYRIPGQYALTEVDMVEYVHSLEANQKSRLITSLYDRPLFLLGNSFPDWLTRILLRLTRNKPLDYTDQQPVYVADAQAATDARLRFFLRNFVVNTEVVDGMSAAEFINELSKRWLEHFGVAPALEKPPSAKARPMARRAVFISYCRSAGGAVAADSKVAFAIRDGLEARGVDVWLDQDQLQGGDDYDKKIKRYIETASLFIPLISETTDARDDAYFRKEWNWAIERLPYRTGSKRHFIVPVLVGKADWNPKAAPDEFEAMHYVRISGDVPDASFLDHLKSLYEESREPAR
jgi:hypothetical protein